jgi:hypothetical protein
VLCLIWRRHQTPTQINNDNNNIPIPVQIDNNQPQSYETQVNI